MPRLTPREQEAIQATLPGLKVLLAKHVKSSARRCRKTGTFTAIEASDDGRGWTTVCVNHGSSIDHASKTDANQWRAAPWGWCEGCQRILAGTEPKFTGPETELIPDPSSAV